MEFSLVHRRNTLRTHYTDKQLQVAMWINSIGFQTELEQIMGRYCLDVYVPELHAAIEIDGDSHYQAKDDKRDLWLKENFKLEYILHVDCNIGKKEFERIFKEWIEKNYGDKDTEKGIS